MEHVWQRLRQDRRIQQWSCILLLVAVFLVFFLFLYVQFQNATLQTLAEASSDFVEWVNTVSNAADENIKTSAMQMFYTSSVRALRSGRTPGNAERTIGLRDLGNFVGSSNFLDSVMVYNGTLDMIFTSEGDYPSAPSGSFHDRDAAGILTHPQNYPYLSPIKRGSGARSCYSFLFFEQSGAHSSALLLNVNARWYESQLLGGVAATENHIIVNAQGQPVVFSNEELAARVPAAWAALQERIAGAPIGGYLLPSVFSDDPCWLYHRLERPDWYYLESLRFDEVSPGLTRVRDVLFLSFGLAGGFLLIALIHLLIRVYLPFRHIRDVLRLSGQDVGNLPMQVNELVARQREQEVARQLHLLREGKAIPGLSFPALLLMTDARDPSALRQLLLPYCPGALTGREEKGTAAILPDCPNGLRAALHQALEAPGAPAACLGLSCQTPQELRESLAALNELRQLRFLYPEQKTLCQELLAQCNAVSGFQAKMASALVAALKSGQLEAAQGEWQRILEAIRRDRYTDFCFAVRYLCKQLGALEKELGLENTASADKLLPDLQELGTLRGHIDCQLERAAAAAALRQRERLRLLCERIWRQIREHYKEESLSAQQIAGQFEVNAAYLNRQFRQAAGMSISDAVHHVRIERARWLLLNTDEPAELIAQRVGYSNIKYFFVVFKKLTGRTPKQFREERGASVR